MFKSFFWSPVPPQGVGCLLIDGEDMKKYNPEPPQQIVKGDDTGTFIEEKRKILNRVQVRSMIAPFCFDYCLAAVCVKQVAAKRNNYIAASNFARSGGSNFFGQ